MKCNIKIMRNELHISIIYIYISKCILNVYKLQASNLGQWHLFMAQKYSSKFINKILNRAEYLY